MCCHRAVRSRTQRKGIARRSRNQIGARAVPRPQRSRTPEDVQMAILASHCGRGVLRARDRPRSGKIFAERDEVGR